MRPNRVSRRSFLRAGTLAGLSLPELLRLRAAAAPVDAKSKDINCIFIFTIGGMSHHDLWDYKADAPAEVRGDFKPIAYERAGHRVDRTVARRCPRD